MRRLLILCMIFCLCVHTAQAASGMEWVNFCPDEWDRSAPVCTLAQQLAQNCGSRQEIPAAVHDWICKNVYFDEDAFAQGIYDELSAGEVFRSRKGVCESIANLAQSLLLEAGIPCIKVWGAAIPEDTAWGDAEIDPARINHTWNEFYMDGHWAVMDCTMDMGNRHSDKTFLPAAWGKRYYDPSPEILAKTHRTIQRGFDLPENIPDPWAMPELEEAAGKIPAGYFRAYRCAVTERELRELLGLDGGTEETITRAQAAALLAEQMSGGTSGTLSFADVGQIPQQQAIAALESAGIVSGSGGQCFSPHRYCTRQEAIVMITRMYRGNLLCM